MILIGIGSNITGPWGTPHETVKKALSRLNQLPTRLESQSQLYHTQAFGETEQPDFINAVAAIETDLSAPDLMRYLHEVELDAERRRSVRWGPRTLDLDLLDYAGEVTKIELSFGHHGDLILPHPGIAERRFVLQPIAEIAPLWVHPVLKLSAQDLLEELP